MESLHLLTFIVAAVVVINTNAGHLDWRFSDDKICAVDKNTGKRYFKNDFGYEQCSSTVCPPEKSVSQHCYRCCWGGSNKKEESKWNYFGPGLAALSVIEAAIFLAYLAKKRNWFERVFQRRQCPETPQIGENGDHVVDVPEETPLHPPQPIYQEQVPVEAVNDPNNDTGQSTGQTEIVAQPQL